MSHPVRQSSRAERNHSSGCKETRHSSTLPRRAPRKTPNVQPNAKPCRSVSIKATGPLARGMNLVTAPSRRCSTTWERTYSNTVLLVLMHASWRVSCSLSHVIAALIDCVCLDGQTGMIMIHALAQADSVQDPGNLTGMLLKYPCPNVMLLANRKLKYDGV